MYFILVSQTFFFLAIRQRVDKPEYYLQIKHGMQFGIFYFAPDVGADDVDFLLGVAQLAREDGVGECFETFGDLEVVPCSYGFLCGKVRKRGGEKKEMEMELKFGRQVYDDIVNESRNEKINLTKCGSAGQAPTGNTYLCT